MGATASTPSRKRRGRKRSGEFLMANERAMRAMVGGLLAALGMLQWPAAAAAQSCPAILTPDQATGPIADVRWLADDGLGGRGVNTAGGLCATAYLAARFDAIGLVPAGPGGSWLQRFPLRVGSTLAGRNRMDIGTRTFALAAEWIPYGFAASGAVEAPLLYGGSGVSRPGEQPPPSATGKILVVEAETPGAGGLYSDPHFKGTIGAGREARAVVILLPPGASLPDPSGETRPSLGAPVLAVSGAAATAVREAARQGATARIDVTVAPLNAEIANVVALLPGSDPTLANEVVVIGAHFDHLGLGGEGSMEPDSRAIHNGADDNASGTAVMLDVARRLASGPRPGRSVLFIGFNGEERGLLGSGFYVTNPTRPLEGTVAMINMDMVGRLRGNTLTVYGLATAPEWNGLLDAANATLATPLTLSRLPDGYGPSDHSSFYGHGIPVLHFFTNTHEDYHRPSDDWQKINAEGMDRIAQLAAGVTFRLAGSTGIRPVTPTLVQTQPPAPPGQTPGPTTGGGYGPYFGSIPDMTPIDRGVRLTGVREGSPAEQAGLRAGDVIIRFGEAEVTDLYAYSYALQGKTAGDVVSVTVLRDGKEITFRAVLGERR
ncbi:MAG: M28 family peptidase [Gemmatimonadetes bacterium]|nr:M28 family peptidase [Gemmatimonadota bacterium]